MRDFLGPAPQQENGSDCGRTLTDMRRITGSVGAGPEGLATESEDQSAGNSRQSTRTLPSPQMETENRHARVRNVRTPCWKRARPTTRAGGSTASERRGGSMTAELVRNKHETSACLFPQRPAALARFAPSHRAGATATQTDLACSQCPVEPKPIRKRRRTRPHPRPRRSVNTHRPRV